MKLLLTTLPSDNIFSVRLDYSLGLRYLASSIVGLIENHSVNVIFKEPALDNVNLEDFKSYIMDTPFDIIAISLMYEHEFPCYKELVATIQKSKPSIKILCGGHYGTLIADSIIRENLANYVLLGDGCHSLPALINILISDTQSNGLEMIPGLCYCNLNGEIIRTTPSNMKESLDRINPYQYSIQYGDTHLKTNKVFQLLSSMGCKLNCSYCSVKSHQSALMNPPRYQRANNCILADIKCLHDYFGATIYTFVDDNFINSDKAHIINLCDELNKLEFDIFWSAELNINDLDSELLKVMYTAGLRNVRVGLESASKSVLERYNKRINITDAKKMICMLRKMSISANIYFILFDCWTNLSEIEETIKFMAETFQCKNSSLLSRIIAYNNTAYTDELKRQDLYNSSLRYGYKFIDSTISDLYNQFCLVFDATSLFENIFGQAIFKLDFYELQYSNDYNAPKRQMLKLEEQYSDYLAEIALSIIDCHKMNRTVPIEELKQKIQKVTEFYSKELLYQVNLVQRSICDES